MIFVFGLISGFFLGSILFIFYIMASKKPQAPEDLPEELDPEEQWFQDALSYMRYADSDFDPGIARDALNYLDSAHILIDAEKYADSARLRRKLGEP